MTNFKQYFRSHLKANIRPLVYILVVVLILTFLIGISNQPSHTYNPKTEMYELYYQSTLYVPVVFMCFLIYILPVMEFSFFKKRINLDCAYSLPISRKSMGAVHYLTGLSILWITFTSSYLVNFILLLSRGSGWFNFTPMIAHYFICFLLGWAIYSIMVFVFNEGNTKGDGIWFMILYTFVFLFVTSTIIETTSINVYTNALYFIPWGLFDTINSSYQSLVEIKTMDKIPFLTSVDCLYCYVFWIALGIASTFGFFFSFGKRRMEKTEEVSNSYFGFRTLIPIYAISLMLLLHVKDSIIAWIIIEILALIGYTIYRRGFHYKKSDIAVLCALSIFLFI